LANKKESLLMWLAWKLPRGLAYWAAIRVITHASYKRPTKKMDSLTPAECLKAWGEK
jgi:hypothetical protein